MALAQQAVQLMVASRFDEASQLFHYPPSYGREERAEDARDVSTNLGILIGVLGVPQAPERVTSWPPFMEVGIAGGDMPYWAGKPNLGRELTIVFRSQFEKAGGGFVFTHLTRYEGRWELQSVSLALPIARSDAKAILGEASAKVLETFERERARRSARAAAPTT